MANAQSNGMTIEYQVAGDGAPLLLVMGLSGQLTDWPAGFVDAIVARGFRVITFDNRDIGLSTKTDWSPPSQLASLWAMITRRPVKGVGYTVADMADDAAGLLDHLDIDRAHVVGMSMGGMIAQEIAIRHPERVLSLCSIMSNTGDRRTGGVALSLLPKVMRHMRPTPESAVKDAVAIAGHVSGPHFDEKQAHEMISRSFARNFCPDGIARQTAAIAGSRDRTELLGSVTAPTLVVHGLVDPLVKPSGGVATAKAIPGARLLALPDMAHDLPRPRWTEMLDALVANTKRNASLAAPA